MPHGRRRRCSWRWPARNYQIDGPLTALWLLASLAAFGTLAYGVNTGLVATAVGLERRAPIAAVWRQHFSGLWLNYFGGVFAACC